MRRGSPVIAMLALVIGGCTKPIAAFEGKWQLDPRTVKANDPKADPDIGASLGLEVLDFNADKTFVLSKRTGDEAGTFDVENGTVTMRWSNPKTETDKKPFLGKLSNEGKSMTVSGGGLPFTMKFSKL